ncbi:helix-turn-helix transcriptional regulator [Glaciimonas sp. PCH181]|uniref:helix-turn-helix transcriptional regulator n=1 Tax=Glaciimonas sp. PCH181 TaxID=2133943 RepID=UPI001374E92C|nr:helix-turn-helix transcriptional regulator [Glaciimonas sp. PCH181]
MEIDDLVAMFEQAPGGKEEMSSARQWLSSSLDECDQGTLKSLRLKAGLSQSILAQKIGLQQPNICAFETGKRKPEYKTAQKLAQSLNVTVDGIYKAFDKNKAR